MSEQAPKYITTIHGVLEVTLAGAADAGYWRERLFGEQLYPFLVDGRAQLALGGTVLRWMGLRFRELTVSVGVSHSPAGESDDGWFLAAAFNSSALLSALERSMFKTPYVHAMLRVGSGDRPAIELRDAQGVRLAAHMNGAHAPLDQAESWWQGSIFLPRSTDGSRRGRFFRARLGGQTSSYDWSQSSDSIVLARPDDPVSRMLADSRFEPLEWRIRNAATHARSATYTRAEERPAANR